MGLLILCKDMDDSSVFFMYCMQLIITTICYIAIYTLFTSRLEVLINPLRMRSRVTVVVLCVCLSVTTLVARELISTVQACYQRNQHDTSKVFNTWISLKTLCSKVMALFTLRSARPYYMKYCSYSTRIRINDTETVTFDRPIHA